MLIAFFVSAAPVTDWGPLMTSAEKYAICAASAAGPYVRSKRSVESVVETAMKACPSQAQTMRAATVTVYASIGLNGAELDQAVDEEFDKQMKLMRTMLGKLITDNRRKAT